MPPIFMLGLIKDLILHLFHHPLQSLHDGWLLLRFPKLLGRKLIESGSHAVYIPAFEENKVFRWRFRDVFLNSIFQTIFACCPLECSGISVLGLDVCQRFSMLRELLQALLAIVGGGDFVDLFAAC